jgi:uncharacterized protein (DUF2062 family)
MRPFKAFGEKNAELFKFIKGIFSKKNLKKIIGELTNPGQSDGLKAFSAGLGVFMGILPVWGLQTLAAIFVAVAFRLNKALVVIFSQISFPPFLPLILFFSYRIGKYWTGAAAGTNINRQVWQYLYGSITLAILAGVVVGLLTYTSLKLTKAIRQYQAAVRLKKVLPVQ